MRVKIKDHEFEVAEQPADYWGWIKAGHYDHEWKAYDQHFRKDQTFLDIGAWVGAHSLYVSTKTNKIIAVEPDPVAFGILNDNLRDYDTRFLAISGHEGEVKLGSGELGWSTTRVNPNAGGNIGAWDPNQTCITACTTLRKFCERLPDPLFIKLDVEGSEEDILKDIAFFRERKPTVLIELHSFWWKNEHQTYHDFEAVKRLYPNAVQHSSNTWVLE